jgi:hypothetical protein
MLDAFRDHAFRGRNLSLVTALGDIATEYAAQGGGPVVHVIGAT